LWQQLQPQDFTSTMRRQQFCDIVQWCTENADNDDKDLCDSVRNTITADELDESRKFRWALSRSINQEDGGRRLLNLKSWDLAQYLAIYDFLYISHILSNSSLDNLLASIARDDVSVLMNPDLRAEQVHLTSDVANVRFNIG
jgi:hypothetical protein